MPSTVPSWRMSILYTCAPVHGGDHTVHDTVARVIRRQAAALYMQQYSSVRTRGRSRSTTRRTQRPLSHAPHSPQFKYGAVPASAMGVCAEETGGVVCSRAARRDKRSAD